MFEIPNKVSQKGSKIFHNKKYLMVSQQGRTLNY